MAKTFFESVTSICQLNTFSMYTMILHITEHCKLDASVHLKVATRRHFKAPSVNRNKWRKSSHYL